MHIHGRSLLRFSTLSAALLVFGMLVIGGLLRVNAGVSYSVGKLCPDWPTCMGAWTPPAAAGSGVALDYLHRLAAFLSLVGVLGALAVSLRQRAPRWISQVLAAAFILLLVQVGLGAALVFSAGQSQPIWMTPLHLSLSLLALAGLSVTVLGVFYPLAAERFSWHSPFGRSAWITLGAMLLLMVSGSLVAATQTSTACASWPLCEAGRLWPADPQAILPQIHRLIVLVTGGLLAFHTRQAWRVQRSQSVILVAITAATVLFFAQALLGAQLVQDGLPNHLLALHQATAVAAWSALALHVGATGLAGRTEAEEGAERQAAGVRRGLAMDFLQLTKPIVVALLLVTTYAGMVIGAEAFPGLGVTFWTLLGGFLAAGGSGAINQYIDREDDVRMQRTSRRPIPSGRLTPAEGLAFGVGIALASFYILVAFVNLLAALLSLAGIFYYVLLYSLILKKTTVQNIVIGGGAGAIPPLVGWAAATGSLNIPALFLFAVIFMWTPPHFWALAIVRRNDYARAGVPMLPVVRGEQETRRQIFIYTLELVGLTLILPVFGLGGGIYLLGAGLLGVWLVSTAWRVWKQSGNKVAWKMYRYSSMYLAFLFVVLMVDALL